MHILLIEDDQALGQALSQTLQHHHFKVEWNCELQGALQLLACHPIDLVLLDLTLPDGDGLDWLKELKASQYRTTPVIIMTARDQIEDRIVGLNLGADDYQAKPFNSQELIARIHAVYRRSKGVALSQIEAGCLKLCTLSREAWWQDQPLSLAKKEFDLLQLLATHPKQIFSKQQLEDRLYDYQADLASNAIEVHIHNLRKKTHSDFIKNFRGVGYKLNPNCENP